MEGTENEMELEEESTFDPVEKLQQFGINASDIQKLKDGGYYTIGMVLKTPQKVSKLSFLIFFNIFFVWLFSSYVVGVGQCQRSKWGKDWEDHLSRQSNACIIT